MRALSRLLKTPISSSTRRGTNNHAPRRFWRCIGTAVAIAGALGLASALPSRALAAGELPVYLRDRGEGISTSLFGGYVRKGELLVYPFYEYTTSARQEYKPSELGYGLERDFRGKLTEHEALIFLAYGLSDRLAVELESALYSTATLRKASGDPSALPARLKESGFGDTQAEVRWRWSKETERRPEIFSYFEVTFPFQKDRVLIGTQEWEFIPALGMTKGSRWGTFTARASATYSDGTLEAGELAAEYLKRTSRSWRWLLAVEGEQDEWAAIGEAQWTVRPNLCLKLNSGFALTSKAPDVAPEVGAAFSF